MTTKTATKPLSGREELVVMWTKILPSEKRALKRVAAMEERTLSAQVRILIRNHLRERGVLTTEDGSQRKRRKST